MKKDVLKKLYDEMGMDFESFENDFENDLINEHTARNGRAVYWYLDNVKEGAIYSDNGEMLTAEEIKNELE